MPFAETMLVRTVLGLMLAAGCAAAFADRIETLGPTWPVVEQDFVEWMQNRMRSRLTPEHIEEIRRQQRERIQAWIDSPPPVEGISRAIERVVRWHDPSITLSSDLVDAEGRVIHAAGTRFNPLSQHVLARSLLFIDGRDDTQIEWMQAHLEQAPHVILVAGSPGRLSAILERPVWYDQRGFITRRLGIRHVPAIVTQEGTMLRIEEVALP